MRLFLGLFLSFALIALAGAAQAADPIVGSWSGAGTAYPKGGQAERVQCRVSYSASTGRTFELNATCAHAGGTFQQSGRVVGLGGNRYTGRLYNADYDTSGNVSISVRGNRQHVTVTSPKGSARATLTRR